LTGILRALKTTERGKERKKKKGREKGGGNDFYLKKIRTGDEKGLRLFKVKKGRAEEQRETCRIQGGETEGEKGGKMGNGHFAGGGRKVKRVDSTNGGQVA